MNHEELMSLVRREAAHASRSVQLTPDSERALDSLCQEYAERGVCLFTGAGTSITESKKYKTPGWWGLLEEACRRIHPRRSEEECTEHFDALCKRHGSAWSVASALADEAGGEARLLAVIRRALVRRTGSDGRYKRLPKSYLDHAGTLNAVLAFCSRVRAIGDWPRYGINPRVRDVLTLNYDWFFEGGGTRKHQANRFKPMASLNSKRRTGRLHVYHVHGYIPHGINTRIEHPLVLTSGSYREAYKEGTFALRRIDEHLGETSAVFVGISFEDDPLVRRLEKLAGEGATTHFVLTKKGDIGPDRMRLLRSARVRAIVYDDHPQIPSILRRVYAAGLSSEDRTVPKELGRRRVGQVRLSERDYWSTLLFNRR